MSRQLEKKPNTKAWSTKLLLRGGMQPATPSECYFLQREGLEPKQLKKATGDMAAAAESNSRWLWLMRAQSQNPSAVSTAPVRRGVQVKGRNTWDPDGPYWQSGRVPTTWMPQGTPSRKKICIVMVTVVPTPSLSILSVNKRKCLFLHVSRVSRAYRDVYLRSNVI